MGHISNKTFVEQQLIGPYAVDELPKPLQISLQESDGTVIDLSGYTVKFEIVRLDGVDPGGLSAGASTVEDAAAGLTQYAFEAADFTTAGHYRGVMWAANGTLRYASIFFEWFTRDSGTTPGV